MSKKVVLVTGGFDPLHIGHIEYFKSAKNLGDILVVGLNSDEWLNRKKGKYFMTWNERAAIISELKGVDFVLSFNDDDGTAIDAIRKCMIKYQDDVVVFANGGDRGKDNIPEMAFETDRVEFVFGVGGSDKKNSSSWILKRWDSSNSDHEFVQDIIDFEQ